MDDLPLQPIVIIVFLIIGAIRWVIENVVQKKSSSAEQGWDDYYEEESESTSQSLEDLYEEARREIVERQNQPVSIPETSRETLRGASHPPRLPTEERVHKPAISQQREIEVLAPEEITPPKSFEDSKNALGSVEQISSQAYEMKKESTSRVRSLLTGTRAARDAVILVEVLGKPKGLR